MKLFDDYDQYQTIMQTIMHGREDWTVRLVIIRDRQPHAVLWDPPERYTTEQAARDACQAHHDARVGEHEPIWWPGTNAPRMARDLKKPRAAPGSDDPLPYGKLPATQTKAALEALSDAAGMLQVMKGYGAFAALVRNLHAEVRDHIVRPDQDTAYYHATPPEKHRDEPVAEAKALLKEAETWAGNDHGDRAMRLLPGLLAIIERRNGRHIQAIGAALSRRDWHATEVAYNALRDEFDATPPEKHRHTAEVEEASAEFKRHMKLLDEHVKALARIEELEAALATQPTAEGWPITATDVLREWFGGERYSRDHEYLDANYREQADRVVALLAAALATTRHTAEDEALPDIAPEREMKLLRDIERLVVERDRLTGALEAALATPPEKHRHTNDEGYEIVGTTFDGVEVLKPAVPSKNFTPGQVRAAIKKHRHTAEQSEMIAWLRKRDQFVTGEMYARCADEIERLAALATQPTPTTAKPDGVNHPSQGTGDQEAE